MARRLSTIAKWVNSNLADEGYRARIENGYCNTDRKVGSLRWPGRGRTGSRLIVERHGVCVFDHNSAETYRTNAEVEDWLSAELVGLRGEVK